MVERIMKDSVLVARVLRGINNPAGDGGWAPPACPHCGRRHDLGGAHLRERRYRETRLVNGPSERCEKGFPRGWLWLGGV